MANLNFINVPKRIVNVGGVTEYIWDGLEVRMTEKGRSVFAVKLVEKETIIPYGGFELCWERYSEVIIIHSNCVIV